MSLPTGSSGQSWGISASLITSGAGEVQAISRDLPVDHIVLYEAPTGLYSACIATFDGVVRAMTTSSFAVVIATDVSANDIQQVSWSLGSTTAPGIFDTVLFALRDQLFFGLDLGTFHFAFGMGSPARGVATGSRKGLLITSLSAQPNETTAESPHMSLEPANFESSLKFQGDLYFVTGASSIKPGMRVIDAGGLGQLYTGSFWTARVSESIIELINRYTSSDAPTASLALNNLVLNEGIITINSGGIAPLIRNSDWGGGFFMPASSRVAVYGDSKDFLVPSGNFTALVDADILSGTLNVFSGSIYLRGPVVLLEISGISASAFINNQPWSAVTVSNVRIDKVTGDPGLPDGVLYLTPSASTANLDEAFIRASGSWIPLVTQSFDIVDGGGY